MGDMFRMRWPEDVFHSWCIERAITTFGTTAGLHIIAMCNGTEPRDDTYRGMRRMYDQEQAKGSGS